MMLLLIRLKGLVMLLLDTKVKTLFTLVKLLIFLMTR
ncbi:P44 outer membrane protein, silent [Anaplasma phagocytophilum]|uniref:p44 outer membrane protein, silent n=1 Tax=Anaplasma phagocytophilum TaxID=948 RepID=A0A098GJ88_ANAPH|nr:P44 outer membrane protein, silent [Anaplasma phagocytophilum]